MTKAYVHNKCSVNQFLDEVNIFDMLLHFRNE